MKYFIVDKSFSDGDFHEKVYSNKVLCTYPEQRPWICKVCGYKGVDMGKYYNLNEYDELVKKFGD
jgi:hypothetical protein